TGLPPPAGVKLMDVPPSDVGKSGAVAAAGVSGPIEMPVTAKRAPGASLGCRPLALTMLLLLNTGVPGPLTVRVTPKFWRLATTPPGVMVIVPGYVPGARPVGVTVTLNVAGVVPRAGLTASQLFCGVSTLTTK